MFRGSVLILVIIALAACAPVPSAQVTPPSTSTPAPTAAAGEVPVDTPAKAPAAQPGGPAITLIRSGGLAGQVVEWDIYPDGRVVSSSGKEATAPGPEITRVISEIAELGFYGLAEPGSKNNSCADCYLYKLTVRDGGKERTLAFTPEATGTPAELLQILERVNILLQILPKE